jgi:hypothetical protein
MLYISLNCNLVFLRIRKQFKYSILECIGHHPTAMVLISGWGHLREKNSSFEVGNVMDQPGHLKNNEICNDNICAAI